MFERGNFSYFCTSRPADISHIARAGTNSPHLHFHVYALCTLINVRREAGKIRHLHQITIVFPAHRVTGWLAI